MAKLVLLGEGFTGRSLEVKSEKTTVGRTEDNTFQIIEASVSSHHCEIFLRGADVVVNDLNSTNGTFVGGKQITGEAVIAPGQAVRFGNVEARLEDGQARKTRDLTRTQGGVRFNAGETAKGPTFQKDSAFTKKSNTGTKLFVIVAIAIAAVALVIIAISIVHAGSLQHK